MDTAPGDDEAPKDPGALQTHHLGYTEKDFEGKFALQSGTDAISPLLLSKNTQQKTLLKIILFVVISCCIVFPKY
jgi:hypothetical protein